MKTFNRQKLNIISNKRKLKKCSIGKNKSFINILDIQKINNKNKVDLSINNKIYSFKTTLLEKFRSKFNFCNCCSLLSKISIDDIINSIQYIKPINGRLER